MTDSKKGSKIGNTRRTGKTLYRDAQVASFLRGKNMDKSAINPQTGKPYAVNPATNQWDDNYFATVVEPKFRGQTSGGYDIDDLVRKQMELQKQVNAPAVQSLEASIPETQQRFATQRTQLEGAKEPLKQRYSNLLDELKRRESVDIGAVQQRNKVEYSARGIPLSSTAYTDANLQATRPISEFYTGQTKDVALSQEEGLREYDNLIANLTGQETEATRSIRNAIAQLQAGAQAKQQAIENAFSQATLDLETKKTEYDINKPYYEPKSGGGGGIDLTGLIQALSGNVQGATTSQSTPEYFKPLSTSYKSTGRSYA